jgi:hypothetical protein
MMSADKTPESTTTVRQHGDSVEGPGARVEECITSPRRPAIRHSDAELEAVASVLLDDYAMEYSAAHLTWRDFEAPAARILAAVAPAIAARALREFATDRVVHQTPARLIEDMFARADEIERTH